ncbi:MAG: carboxypeptidase-like regulatory domain-containing protein, partial [Acidobacteria bacterium]|nr:carboxypeptidase-like regulatory domain-containing protein [Acidobacteriota bacterium]
MGSHLTIGSLGAFLLLWVAPCHGQAGKAELFGVVLDASGLPVPQVTMRLEEPATGAMQNTSSSERGEYHFFGLLQGNYMLSAEKPGFRAYRQDGLVLRIADRVSLDIRLEVGDVVQTVEVTAAAPLLQATTGT